MVYRLIPSYQMKPVHPEHELHFGMEDLSKPGLLKGLGLGLLLAVVVLAVLAWVALKTDKLNRYVDQVDGNKKLNWKRCSLELMLPVVLLMLVGGAVVGHNCSN
jgi:heme A synthase